MQSIKQTHVEKTPSAPAVDHSHFFEDVDTLRTFDVWRGGILASFDLCVAPVPADLLDRVASAGPALQSSGWPPTPWDGVADYVRQLYMSKALGYRGPCLPFLLRAPHEIGLRQEDISNLEKRVYLYLKRLFGENVDFWFVTRAIPNIHVDLRGYLGTVGSSEAKLRKVARDAGSSWNHRHRAYEFRSADILDADGGARSPTHEIAGICRTGDRLVATNYVSIAARQLYENHVRVIEALRSNGAHTRAA